MNLLSDIITYVRRIVKTPSNAVLSDALIIDYINRFWIHDIDARIQLFDFKTKYQFQTQPGYDQYNMPLYAIQTELGDQEISYYPVYQGFENPVYINGVQIPFYTQRSEFYKIWPNVTQIMTTSVQGNGTSGPYSFQFPIAPNNVMPNPLNVPFNYILRGHVDMTGVISIADSISTFLDPPTVTPIQSLLTIPAAPVANVFPAVYITANGSDGRSIVVCDSGQFLDTNQNLGLMMEQGQAPKGNQDLPGGYESSFVITGATQAAQCVLTCISTFTVGQLIQISGVGGMTELNGNTYRVVAVTGTTVTINVDSTGFGIYTGGGLASSFINIINYFTGEVSNLYFPQSIPDGVQINAQCYFFASGLPRAVLFNNNTLTFRMPPSQQWLVEMDAYLTPAAFLTTGQSVQFAYMSEYVARGAARKILSDTGDVEQFNFYEPLFKEQETLVWKRSQRQFTSTRTPTIYSQGPGWNSGYFNGGGGLGY